MSMTISRKMRPGRVPKVKLGLAYAHTPRPWTNRSVRQRSLCVADRAVPRLSRVERGFPAVVRRLRLLMSVDSIEGRIPARDNVVHHSLRRDRPARQHSDVTDAAAVANFNDRVRNAVA